MKKKRHNINFEDCNSSKISGAKLFLLIIVSLFSYPINAQLSNFTLQVTKTDETCPGNGTLNFTVSNTTPGATFNYRIYKLPNVTTEIANISATFIGGLSNGTYRVIATQTLSPNSNTQTQDISIANTLVPFDISVSSTNAICGNDATITVNTITGSAISYEITSGPVTRPVQSSNIFTALPAGTFQVRAFDICGEASVETRTIFTTTPQMTVGSASFLDAELPGCDLITASHGLESPDNSIHYPIQYQFTVYPPDGSDPIISSGSLTNGATDYQVISHVIPFYHNQVYSYDLQVIDYCGVVHNVNNNVVNQKINLIINPIEGECDTYFLSLILTKYRGLFTITFLQAPAGFDPSLFNTSFPGSFSASETFFGEETNPLPMGEYTIEINDACGRTTSQTIVLEYIPVEPIINTSQTGGCSATTGNIKIELPNRMITSATIIVAPPEYTPTLPQNVSSNIIPNDGLQLIEIPVGTYVFILFDECGKEYTAEATITTSTNNEVGFNSRPDCEIGKGAVRIRAAGSGLVSVIITAAPAGFQNALPFNASFNIGTNGNFSMANLPPGNYTFNTINGCGSAKTLFITITGYAVTTDEFELFQHCGSFDFFFSHSSNGIAGQSFWLQKLDPITNTWMHPETNVPYAEGSNPENSNSLSLFNSVTLYNLTYTGTFRIIKRYETFDNGSIAELKNCINTLHEFTYNGILQINGLESLTCNGVISDVKVLVNGVPPFEFKIIEKNGAPFTINNGTNAIFTNLDPAVYKFEVTDACGVIRNYEFDVALLPSPVFANQPDKYVLCDDSSNDGIENFMLSSLNAQILGNQLAVDYSIKYYETISDANSEINALSEIFSSPTQDIFARVNHPTSLSCFAITVVNLEIKEYLALNMGAKFSFCDSTNITVHADSGYNSYVWSDGQTGSSATFDQPGIYTLTFTKGYDAVICSATHQIEITESNAPIIKEILLEDWTDYNNSIEVLLEIGNGDYAYSLDNIHFQSENIFTGLPIGAYTVYVKDRNGCGPNVSQDVFLLTYPKFFTPNGDGFNDFWRIKYAFMEPNMLTYIFDRYGKLITGFGANDPGWDGTLNGKALPSTDYWFLVKRENGKEHRGHFAMKR